MSGIIKGIGKAVKGVVKGVAHFVKRYWKPIVIAAAVVFTAGIATVGVAGFSSMAAAGGGGIGGFMSAVGGTFAAGAGTLTGGIIGGTPASAGLGATSAGTGGGLLSTSTAYTGPGAIAAPGAASEFGAANLGATVNAAYGGGAAAAANAATSAVSDAASSGAFNSLTGAGTYTGPSVAAAAPSASVGSSQLAPIADIATTSAPIAPAATQSPGLLGTILNSKAAGPLIYGGMQAIQGYAQGKALEDQYNQTKPLSYWGVGARGNPNGGGAVNSIFGPSETLTGSGSSPFTPTPTNGEQPLQQISPYVPDARATLPNGVQWMPNLPNAQQGLMTVGWDVNTGKPIYANNPTQQYMGV